MYLFSIMITQILLFFHIIVNSWLTIKFIAGSYLLEYLLLARSIMIVNKINYEIEINS